MVPWLFLASVTLASAFVALTLVRGIPQRQLSSFIYRVLPFVREQRKTILPYFRLIVAPLVALGLVLGTAAFTVGLFQFPTTTVTLPIEVIGPDQTTETIQLEVSDPSSVDHLWVKAYSIGYPYHLAEERGYTTDKASIRLNSGSWVDINNQTVTCQEPEQSARCVEGAMHTIRFRLPIESLGSLQQSNTLSFRFNYADPSGAPGDPSTGYRILGLELRDGSGSDKIDETSFEWDDPGSWTAPDGYGTSSDVSAGKNLWHERNFLKDGWSGEQIWASCADCHLKNGEDLQYFGFSNKSIIQRSRFHGLSSEQGKQIAAYIRSIDITTDDGRTIDPPGRPWNPPYQPGPTSAGSRAPDAPRTDGTPFSNLDAVYWAAGAGLDWALDTDREMKDYLFPNGITSDAYKVEAEPGTDRALNMREIPLPVQMPDWNEWLPAVHPRDAFGSAWDNHTISSFYEQELPDLVQQARDGKIGKARRASALIWKHMSEGVKGETAFYDGVCSSNTPQHGDWMVARLSCLQWTLTKTFEVMQPNHFEDEAKSLYGPAAEPMQWFSDARVVFDQAPHILGPVKGSKNEVMDRYHDTAWYQLQLVLNPGSAIGTKIKPEDWRYHFQHLSAFPVPAPHGWRYVASYLKLLHVAEGIDANKYSDVPEGWWMRHTSPSFLDPQHIWARDALGTLSSEEYRRVVNLTGQMMIDGFTEEPMEEWARGTGPDGIEPESHDPQPLTGPIGQNVVYPDHFWTTLRNWGEAGAAYEILEPLARWAETAWPKGDWMKRIEPYKGNLSPDSNAPPSVEIETPADSALYTAPATIRVEATAQDPDGTVQKVQFVANGTSVGSDSDAPYSTTWNASGGAHHLVAVATDGTGRQARDSIDVIVKRADGTLPGVVSEYYEGDWSALPDFEAMTPVSQDTTAAFTMAPAQRDDHFGLRFTSYVEIPSSETGTYTFYTTSDDGSRLLVNGREVVNNDGLHAPEEQSGTVSLSSGWHKIVVEYFEKEYAETLKVSWKGPSFSKEEIPSSRLFVSPGQTVSQNVPLEPGWNVISSRVAPTAPDLDSVFSDVSVEVVKDENANQYIPSENRNEIGAWDSTEAYKVYTESKQTLTLEGAVVHDTTAISLEKGWNLIPYLPASAQSVKGSLESISSELVILKDEAGRTYVPSYGIAEIGQLEPTEGYQVYVETPTELIYSESSSTTKATADAMTVP
jgi:hypothetical protein